MSEFYFIFVWLAVVGVLSMYLPVRERIKVLGKTEMRWKATWAIIAFLPVIHLASMGMPRSDTWLYISSYTASDATWTSILTQIYFMENGFGYIIFQDMIKIITGGNVTAFRVIIALCQSIPVILIYRKYSPDYLFSVFLFVATGCHIAWMMNGIRQFLAVAIIFAGTGFLIQKKLVPVILLILVAATIHISALMMLPVVFIVQGKAWNKKTILYIVAAVIAMLIFSKRIDMFEKLLQGTGYGEALNALQEVGDDGVHPLRVLVSAVPVILAFYAREPISRKKDPFLNICVNMSVITLGLYLVAMVTSGILIGRLPIYVSLYNSMLLAYLIFKIDWGDYNTVLQGGSIIGYIFYYLVQYGGWV